MAWLIWKELRLQWRVLVIAAAVTLIPFAILWYVSSDSALAGNYVGTFLTSVLVLVVTMALLGGHAIAPEWADRSAEFLAYMPVSRTKIVLSKLFVPVMAVALIWTVNLAFLVATRSSFALSTYDARMVQHTVLAGLVAFSVAWFASALQDSPTIAAGIGLAMLPIVGFAIWLVSWFFRRLAGINGRNAIFIDAAVQNRLTLVIGVVVAIGCFACGTWYYLRRLQR
jgi:ABC-type transport system involved in multi-copper enzyme maturation permease subunit